MGIDPKPFNPKTYVEEAHFVTDESGNNRRIRLENNIVRWREVRKPDGTKTVSTSGDEFLRWHLFIIFTRNREFFKHSLFFAGLLCLLAFCLY